MNDLILISKEEYLKLQERLGDKMPYVTVTNKHKAGKRKKRYIEEDRKVMKLLKEMRASTGKGGTA